MKDGWFTAVRLVLDEHFLTPLHCRQASPSSPPPVQSELNTLQPPHPHCFAFASFCLGTVASSSCSFLRAGKYSFHIWGQTLTQSMRIWVSNTDDILRIVPKDANHLVRLFGPDSLHSFCLVFLCLQTFLKSRDFLVPLSDSFFSLLACIMARPSGL